MSRWIAFVLVLAIAVWSGLAAQVQDNPSNYRAPIAQLAQYEFFEGELSTLSPVSGTWATAPARSTAVATTTAIAIIDAYNAQSPFFDPLPEISAQKFWYRARMLNQRSGSSTRVGIVYQYQDPGNFYEVSFSPTGSVFLRDVSNGVGTTVASGTYSGGGQNKWFDVQVEWTAAETIVRVNGLPVVRGIKQDGRTHGRVGVITRQTKARFDRLLVTDAVGRSGIPRELQRRRAAMASDQGQLERRQWRVPELCGPARQHHSAADLRGVRREPECRRRPSRSVPACSIPMAPAATAWASYTTIDKTVGPLPMERSCSALTASRISMT